MCVYVCMHTHVVECCPVTHTYLDIVPWTIACVLYVHLCQDLDHVYIYACVYVYTKLSLCVCVCVCL